MEKRVCKKCGSTNINYQVLTNTITKDKHHSLLWWLIVGWWWIPIKWIFFTGIAVFMFVLKMLGVRKKKSVFVDRTKAVCQDCGHAWDI